MSATFQFRAVSGNAVAVTAGPATTGQTVIERVTAFFSPVIQDETKQIADGLRRQDPDVVNRLIEQYQYRLYRYLVYLTGDRDRAEDFFQETWVRVLERGHQFDGKWKFEAWLFSIARNLVIDWQRRKRPSSLEAMGNPETGEQFEVRDEKSASPLEEVLSGESEALVKASLGKVPALYREVLLLRFQEEMKLEEMAAVLSTPVSTVKSRLYRGLEALKSALGGQA